MRKIKRNIYIYSKLILQQLKAILEYQADFYITMVAAVFTQILGFIFLWVIYKNIPDINGWGFWEIVSMYAMIYITEGVGSAFFDGIWTIGFNVNRGEFDRYLLRPVSPLTQLLGSRVGMNGYGNLITGGILLTQALINSNIHWSLTKVLIGIIFLISASVIRASINLVSNSTSFWYQASSNSLSFMVHNIGDFAKYPLQIYPAPIRAAVSILIPYAFVSYFPAVYLYEKPGMLIGLLTPVVAVVALCISVFVFYKGLSRYDSTGN